MFMGQDSHIKRFCPVVISFVLCAYGCSRGPVDAHTEFAANAVPKVVFESSLRDGVTKLGWTLRENPEPYCGVKVPEVGVILCWYAHRGARQVLVTCENHSVTPARTSADCVQLARRLFAASGINVSNDNLVVAKGGTLSCRRGAEKLELNIPAEAMGSVNGLLERAGFRGEECEFQSRP
jgi:hypothetical protein